MLISLMGYMGCGKSSISRLLSSKLGFSAVDLDQLICQAHGKSIAEIFSRHGELTFRKMERKSLEDILSKNLQKSVLSLGGGTPCYYENIGMIIEKSKSIYLRAKASTLTNRLIPEKHLRPLIKNIPDDDLELFIAKHLFDRNPFYHQAQVVVDTDEKDLEEISDEIIHRLSLHPFLR